MIESFFYATWMLGQAVYWSFFKLRTEIACEESWNACLGIVRTANLI
jgi:hypothetical protein